MSVTLIPDVVSTLPSGRWILLRGTVRNDGAGAYGWLHMDLGSGRCDDLVIPIPITRKGTILELVRVPDECSRGVWRLGGDVDVSAGYSVALEQVSAPERVLRMLHRVLPMFHKHARRKRLRAGLTIGTLLLDLPGAYKIAGKFRVYSPQMSYPDWMDAFDRLSPRDLLAIRRHVARFKAPPQFSVLVHIDLALLDGLYCTLSSLAEQLFPATKVFLLLADDSDAAQVLSVATSFSQLSCLLIQKDGLLSALGDGTNGKSWFVQICCGDSLSAHALYWLAAEQQAHPLARIIYTDDDLLNSDGERCAPRFKPDWSLELLRSLDYIGPFFAFPGYLLSRMSVGSLSVTGRGNYDLLLNLIDTLQREEEISHIPALLYHCSANRDERLHDGVRTIRSHLERNGISASVSEGFNGVVKVGYSLPAQPLVSIIIPTRDNLEMVRRCLDSIFEKSSYRCFEIILIDNQSALAETRAYFTGLAARTDVRILPYEASFNYSAMNNLGIAHARGEVVCLLNNDTEVITADWLEEMLGHLYQDRVGVVGAKLLYPDGRVQHGGDTVGPGGCAHHLHSFIDRDDPGYCNRAIAAQDLSAVTAACMVTWRWLYQQLEGLDAEHLQVAFNDVDYCLRVREAGYRVVWTPHAQLYHHESASRGKNDTPEKIKRSKLEADYMRKKWACLMQHDPFYNPNLSYERPDFSLSNAPMVRRPWKCQ